MLTGLLPTYPWIRIRPHNRGAASRVTGRHLLPDNGSHVVETDGFAELDDLGSDGDDFIAAIIYGSCELITDIYAQAATALQNAMAFFPYEVQVVDIIFVGIMETDLLDTVVVFELPVWRRRNNEMNGFIRNFPHGTRIGYKNLVLIHFVFILYLICLFNIEHRNQSVRSDRLDLFCWALLSTQAGSGVLQQSL